MVIRATEYLTIKEVDARVAALEAQIDHTPGELEEEEDLLMFRGELEMTAPASHPRHRP